MIIVPDFSINQVQTAIIPFKSHLIHNQIIGHDNNSSENSQVRNEDYSNAVLDKAEIDKLFDLLCNTRPKILDTENINVKNGKEMKSEVKMTFSGTPKKKRGRKRIKDENEMKDFIVQSGTEGNDFNELMDDIFNDEETENIKEDPRPKKVRKSKLLIYPFTKLKPKHHLCLT